LEILALSQQQQLATYSFTLPLQGKGVSGKTGVFSMYRIFGLIFMIITRKSNLCCMSSFQPVFSRPSRYLLANDSFKLPCFPGHVKNLHLETRVKVNITPCHKIFKATCKIYPQWTMVTILLDENWEFMEVHESRSQSRQLKTCILCCTVGWMILLSITASINFGSLASIMAFCLFLFFF